MGYFATWRRVNRIMEHLGLKDCHGDGKMVYHPRGVLGMPDHAADELATLKRRLDGLMRHLGVDEVHRSARYEVVRKGGPEPGDVE